MMPRSLCGLVATGLLFGCVDRSQSNTPGGGAGGNGGADMERPIELPDAEGDALFPDLGFLVDALLLDADLPADASTAIPADYDPLPDVPPDVRDPLCREQPPLSGEDMFDWVGDCGARREKTIRGIRNPTCPNYEEPPAMPPGLLPAEAPAMLRRARDALDAARATPGLEARTANFAPDRFGNPREALLATGSGLVGSKTTDFLKNRKAWSWAAWVRPDNLSPAFPGNFYSEGNAGLSGHVSIYQGTIMVQLWNEAAAPNWGSVTTGALLSVGTWSHVAVTFEAPEGSNGPGWITSHLTPIA
jgi:hypothetical protein